MDVLTGEVVSFDDPRTCFLGHFADEGVTQLLSWLNGPPGEIPADRGVSDEQYLMVGVKAQSIALGYLFHGR